MENITVEKYIAGIRQELLPKYHLSRHSIDDITAFYRHRLSDKWNPSSLHYHFLVSTSTEDTNRELALSIYRSLFPLLPGIAGFFLSEKEFLTSPEQLLKRGNNAFAIIGKCGKEPLDEDGINRWTAARKILNNPDCPTCFLLLSIDEFQNKFKDTPVYEPLFHQIFKYHLETNTRYSLEDYLEELDNWLDEQFPGKRTESFDRGMNDYLSAVLAKPHTNEGIEFLEDLKKRVQDKYYRYEDLDVIDERCVPYYNKEASDNIQPSLENVPAIPSNAKENSLTEPSIASKDSENGSSENEETPEEKKKKELEEQAKNAKPFVLPENGDFFDISSKSVPDTGVKNLLLLTLSTISVDPNKPYELRKSTANLSRNQDQDDESVEYYYQLEPVPYKLMHDFANKGSGKGSGKKLDGILIIASPKTTDKEVTKNDPRYGFFCDTAENYFKYATSQYATKEKNGPLSYETIPTNIGSNVSNPKLRAQETRKFIHNVVEKIRALNEHYKNLHIYVDTHGGFRTDQEALNSILSLLQMENISIPQENIYSVEFDNGKTVFTSASEIFNIMNFVSGIHECINYGQIKSLDLAMKEDTTELQKNILESMHTIAEGIQLCDVKKFETGLSRLSDFLTDFSESKEEKASLSYLSLFQALISESYGKNLLDNEHRTTIDEIKWCIEKNFIQQALILVESKMPKEIIRNNFLYCPDLFETSDSGITIKSSEYTHFKEDNSPKKGWESVENYVFQQFGYTKKDRVSDTFIDLSKLGNLNSIPYFRGYSKTRFRNKDDASWENREYTIREQQKASKEINILVRLHMQLKQIRNETNHAGEDDRFSIEAVCGALNVYVDLYEKIIEKLNH